jgi:DNA primase
VATPLAWTEVADASLVPSRFGLRDMPARLAEISAGKDPWAGFWRRRYGIAAAQRKLAGLG